MGAQRRYVQREYVEPEVQVLAEAPLLDERQQVPVGRGDHPDVDVVDLVAADGPDVAELQHAEQLGLQAEGHVADLVEQQRAAVGLGEQPLARLDGAGEPSPRVPEDLALEQLLRDGGGVHGDEWPGASLAPRVDGPGDELLARAGLAGDERRGARPRDEVDGGLQRPHRRAIPDDDVGRHARRGDERPLALVRMLPRLEGPGHGPAQVVDVARLDGVPERAPLDGVDGLVNSPGRREEDDRQRRVSALQVVEQLEPVHSLHANVADDGVERLLVDQLERDGRVLCQLARVTVDGEEAPQRFAHSGVVVHDQEPRLHWGASTKAR